MATRVVESKGDSDPLENDKPENIDSARFVSRHTFKPYGSKDDLIENFNKLFPAKKDFVKIIVAEIGNRIVFALHLLIYREEENQKNLGHIYDFLLNLTCFQQLKNPVEIQTHMIHGLELIAWINKCKEVVMLQGTIDDKVMEERQFKLI